MFPKAVYQRGTGSWRVTAKDRGRPDLEEDISFHPGGVQDFGLEHGLSPIDAVIEFGGAADAVAAAHWLCERLGIEPATLGWNDGATPDNAQVPPPHPGTTADDAQAEGSGAPELHRASDWDARIIPPQRWIVEDWIPRQQVTGLYGLGGSYKTWLLIQGLMAAAVGEVFLGRRTRTDSDTGPVL